jgi:hypothetical protein
MKFKSLVFVTSIFTIIFFFATLNAQNTSGKCDYQVKQFVDFGWVYYCVNSGNDITITCYANQNKYHKSGAPIYILQGTIGKPDKQNTQLDDNADPSAGVVAFTTLWVAKGKKDQIPFKGSIWYKKNSDGRDRLEMGAGEGTLSILIAK